jgi:hypothetical protein
MVIEQKFIVPSCSKTAGNFSFGRRSVNYGVLAYSRRSVDCPSLVSVEERVDQFRQRPVRLAGAVLGTESSV